MPAIKHFVVTRTQRVTVDANTALDALLLADFAFMHGQDANGGIAKDQSLRGVFGDTTSHVEIVDVQVKLEDQ